MTGDVEGVVAGRLRGWLLAADEREPLELALVSGERTVSRTVAELRRPDVERAAGGGSVRGFAFDLTGTRALCTAPSHVVHVATGSVLGPTGWRVCEHAARAVADDAESLRPLFFAEHYRYHHALAALTNEASFRRYVERGIFLGHDPCPWLSGEYLREHHGELIEGCEPAALAYLRYQRRLDVRPSTLFDPAHYARVYPEIGDRDLLAHYVGYGHAEGRFPVERRLPEPVREQIERMSRIEPAIGPLRTDFRSIVRYGLPTAADYVPRLVRRRFGGNIESIVCVSYVGSPALGHALLDAYQRRHGIDRVLLIVTEESRRGLPERLARDTRVLFLEDECRFTWDGQRIDALHNVFGLLAPRRITDVGSRLAGEVFRRFGAQLGTAAALDVVLLSLDSVSEGEACERSAEPLRWATNVYGTNPEAVERLRRVHGGARDVRELLGAGPDHASQRRSPHPDGTAACPEPPHPEIHMTSHAQPSSHARKRVCLVTEELPGFGPSGGIGAAFEEMAVSLARAGHEATILYCGEVPAGESLPEPGASFFRNEGIEVLALDVAKFTHVRHDLRGNAYAVWRTLEALDGDFDVVHFHDYKGLGFYACEAKRQGLALRDTRLVVQLHGPTRWTVEANRAFFTEESQLIADHLERRSVEMADALVSPSAYLAGWARSSWGLSESREIETIPNLCGLLEQRLRRARGGEGSHAGDGPVRNLVIFGRHEARKGIDVASAALTRLGGLLAERRIAVHFVGQQGRVNGQPSALYFAKAAKSWKFDYTFNFGLTRFTAGEYIAALENALVIVPAPTENSPYAVLEPLILGQPVLSSDGGGGHELLAPESRGAFCCPMDASGLETAIRALLDAERLDCRAAFSSGEIEARWLDFHERVGADHRSAPDMPRQPLVTVGITHFERPHKLGDAVISMLKQDYGNLEIIVLDDGSASPAAVAALDEQAVFLERAGVRLLREENRYLGGARNRLIEEAGGEYILFLDDDDIALPRLVSTLVDSALRTGSSVTSCMSHYLPEDRRSPFLAGEKVPDIVDYFPSGGPLSLALEQNVYGTATSLIRLDDLRALGGYTELRDVGNEDFELYLRFAQAGRTVTVCPRPLFMYEVGRPSMLSGMGMDASFRRCFDAVSFDTNPSAWSDYSSLNVGRHLVPRAENRQLWLNSFQEDAEERNRLCDRATAARDYVQLAARVADRSGNARLAAAFRHAFDFADRLRSRPEVAEEESGEAPLAPLPGTASEPQRSELPRALRRARHHFAIGEIGAGLEVFDAYLDTTHSVDELVLIPLRELAGADVTDAERERVASSLDALREKRYRGPREGILLALLRVARRHDLRRLELEIAERMLELDRKAYRERYKDIRDAERRGTLEGFEHFVKAGRREGRVGFERVAAALELLEELDGVTYVIEDFRGLFEDPERGAPDTKKAA